MEAKEQGISTLIRDLRSSREMSIRSLGQAAGVSPSAICNWEAGRVEPRIPELEAVLEALQASQQARQEAYARINAPRALAQLRSQTTLLENAPEEHPLAFPSSGDLLRALRHRCGWTLEWAAARLGVQPSTISRWERSQMWPSESDLEAYCTLLNVHPEERSALTNLGLCQPSLYERESVSLEALEQQGVCLQQDVIRGETTLMDLRFLSLEALLWQRASRSRSARHLLAQTYVWHAQWLLWRERLPEAGQTAQQALRIVEEEDRPEPYWLRAVYVYAASLAESGKHPAPMRGARFVQDWLWAAHWPVTEAWMCHTIASYALAVGETEEALKMVERAKVAADRSENRAALRHSGCDGAVIMAGAHRSEEALALLSTEDHTNVYHQAYQASVWTSVLLRLGATSEAYQWYLRACEIVRRHDLPSARYTDWFATRFE